MFQKLDFFHCVFFQRASLRNGTTTALYLGTIHVEGTLELCNAAGMDMVITNFICMFGR